VSISEITEFRKYYFPHGMQAALTQWNSHTPSPKLPYQLFTTHERRVIAQQIVSNNTPFAFGIILDDTIFFL